MARAKPESSAKYPSVGNEFPGEAMSEALLKAEALTLVLQQHVTSNRSEEAPLRPHWLHWYLDALHDNIAQAQRIEFARGGG